MHPLLERNTYVISLDGLGGIPLEMAIAGFRKDRFTADRPFLEISHWSALSGRNGASNYQTCTQMHNRFRNDTKTPQRTQLCNWTGAWRTWRQRTRMRDSVHYEIMKPYDSNNPRSLDQETNVHDRI